MDARLEIWGGHECTVNRVGDAWRDQTILSGHQTRIDDLDRFAGLGLSALRYPVLWERTEVEPGRYDWSWADERLGRLRDLGLRPIVGLVHHGSGPAWTDLLDPGFAAGLARFAGAAAERYPWVQDWTPVNEPLTTARFSALYGHWYPHLRDEAAFWQALINQLEGVREAMAAIRRVIPGARLIQTEDFGHTWGTDPCAAQAAFENARRLMTWDLLTGRVGPDHPLHPRLLAMGFGESVSAFVERSCPPDLIGLNHYVTSDRFLDHRLGSYPQAAHGGNGDIAYADVEAVRVLEDAPDGWAMGLNTLWARYQIPIAVTECHLGCAPDQQVRWLEGCVAAVMEARRAGISVEAVTVWSLLGSFDWDSLLTESRGRYEPGVFDISQGEPQTTPLAAAVERLALAKADRAPPDGPAWWREASRLIYPSWPNPLSVCVGQQTYGR